ncbi:hypothetical protein BN381_90040 [Candidatus Microthrix parvicella RN1]|uniref:Uncharacterized protein n=1 Tax=Candidatus Neomicrothrix parvicella RN1 TaxID=1229780 RepID=R4Z4W9_9ACTN|nr:hypothetical protein BN381_90040 [Candidatus Microthrix parvicella RN1]
MWFVYSFFKDAKNDSARALS